GTRRYAIRSRRQPLRCKGHSRKTDLVLSPRPVQGQVHETSFACGVTRTPRTPEDGPAAQGQPLVSSAGHRSGVQHHPRPGTPEGEINAGPRVRHRDRSSCTCGGSSTVESNPLRRTRLESDGCATQHSRRHKTVVGTGAPARVENPRLLSAKPSSRTPRESTD